MSDRAALYTVAVTRRGTPGRAGAVWLRRFYREIDVLQIRDSRGDEEAHPEAVDGGPIAFVRDGDQITLDVAHRTLDVEVDDLEWESRKDGWEPLPPKYTRGVLGKYAKVVQSAAHGAVCG